MGVAQQTTSALMTQWLVDITITLFILIDVIINALFLIFLANIVVLTEISRIIRKFVPVFEKYLG